MTQIKQNQIIPARQKRPNPVQGPPRDVPLETITVSAPVPISEDTLNSSGGSSATPNATQSIAPPARSTASSTSSLLATPFITGIKSQTINFQSDGTATVDVVVTVEDSPGATEYDIRIAKSAGNL